MIAELLGYGASEAKTGRELAGILECNIRDVTMLIEKERREGSPICAASGDNPGYYLAANEFELQSYCNALNNRANEMKKTYTALITVLNNYRAKKKA